MSVLLQISDPHFGTEQPRLVDALVRLAARQRPDVVVLSGDITQRALPAQFRAARRFVERLGAPVLAIPGNHDIPLIALGTRAFAPYARHCKEFGPELEPRYESADLLVVCVNTTRAWRHKNGAVSRQQVERVAARLAQARPGQLRVVVVHQPIAVLRGQDVHDRLRGHALAQRRWAEAGADLVMGGHIHLPYVVPLPGLARPLWAVQAGTAVSTRVREGVPNSVNIVRWGQSGASAPAGASHLHSAARHATAAQPPAAMVEPLGTNRRGDVGLQAGMRSAVDAAAPRCCVIEQWDCDALQADFVRSTVTEVQPARAGDGA